MVVAEVVVASRLATAQGAPVAVKGLAYDSVRGAPLGNASVTIAGGAKSTATDSHGRFQFDSVVPGVYTFVMHHPALDSLGFQGMSTRATVTDGRNEVRVAIPSFATLWHAACGESKPPRDSGFVYGTIRDASSLEPVGHAAIDLIWTDLVVEKRHGVFQRRWRIQTQSDAGGGYAICGVPTSLGLRIHATTDASASGLIDLPPRETPARRRDLLVGPATGSDSAHRGTIDGVLTDASGRSFADARIVMDEVPEVRSGADGRFKIPGVPIGTRQLEVRSIGLMPIVAVVDVMPGETVPLALNVGSRTTLHPVRVTAPAGARRLAEEFEFRRRSGSGYSMDSTAISRYPRFINVFDDIPSIRPEFHGSSFVVSVRDPRGGRCIPDVRIDGAEAAYGHLVDLFPQEIAALEVYPHSGTVPIQFLRPGIRPACGIILVWTKYGFQSR
jgi:Carboxypeptidase regulatory-like domain